MNRRKGFTLIEILVAIALVSCLLAASMSFIDYGLWTADAKANDLSGSFNLIWSAYGRYSIEKNVSPAGLADASFVPAYLFVPTVPAGFDAGYGVSGFHMGQQTGQPIPDNGYFVCARASVRGAGDVPYRTMQQLSAMMPAGRFYYGLSCPGVVNTPYPGGTTTMYVTCWLMRN